MANLINIDKPINSTTETAFQRAVLRNGETILGGKRGKTKITWLDIELPVETDNGSPKRRHCVDLIGKTDDNHYIICELKFGKSADEPEKAIKQLLEYHKAIKANYKNLDADDRLHHPGGKAFKWENLAAPSTKLYVVANAAYWAYWSGRRGKNLKDIKDKYPGENIEFLSVDIPSDYFEKQKEKEKDLQGLYTPEIETKFWDIL